MTPTNPKKPTKTTVESWWNIYRDEFDKEKRAWALSGLAEMINRMDEEDRREAAVHLRQVKIRKGTEERVEKIVDHLINFKDERGYSGYITIRIAKDREIVPSDYNTSSWKSLMSKASKDPRLPNLRAHYAKLQTSSSICRQPTLYVTDNCPLQKLFDRRTLDYDVTDLEDARQMVNIISTHPMIVDAKPLAIVSLIDLSKSIEDPLFPKLSFNDKSLISTFVTQHLHAALPGGKPQWVIKAGVNVVRRV